MTQHTINPTQDRIAELKAAREYLNSVAKWNKNGITLSQIDPDRTRYVEVMDLIAVLWRLGWITEERATPQTSEEQRRAVLSVFNLAEEARLIVARAEEPYVFTDGDWVPTGWGSRL